MKKYELTDEFVTFGEKKLYRIRAISDFSFVKAGELGGFVESEDNLAQLDDAWVYGNARVCGDAQVCGNAEIKSMRDYIVFKNWWSSGRYFTWTRSNNMWAAGCFYGTGKQLVDKAYKDSEVSGLEYKRIVNYINELLNENAI